MMKFVSITARLIRLLRLLRHPAALGIVIGLIAGFGGNSGTGVTVSLDDDDPVIVTASTSGESGGAPTFFVGSMAESSDGVIVLALGYSVFGAYNRRSGCLVRIWQGELDLVEGEGGAVPNLKAVGEDLTIGGDAGCWELPADENNVRTSTSRLVEVRVSRASTTLLIELGDGTTVVSETLCLIVGPEAMQTQWPDVFGRLSEDVLRPLGVVTRRFSVAQKVPAGFILHWNRQVRSLTGVQGFRKERNKGNTLLDRANWEGLLLHGADGPLEVWQAFAIPEATGGK